MHGHAVLERFPWVRDLSDARLVTFLREPLAGAISLWRYQCRHVPWDAGSESATPKNIEEYLIDGYNHNRYQKWISRSGRTLEQYFMVGIVERFDDSVQLLADMAGWGEISYESVNLATGDQPDINPTVADRFKQMNEGDYKLWHDARRRLDRQLRHQGKAF